MTIPKNCPNCNTEIEKTGYYEKSLEIINRIFSYEESSETYEQNDIDYQIDKYVGTYCINCENILIQGEPISDIIPK